MHGLHLSCREGLVWVDINWMDNGECLDLIEKVGGGGASTTPRGRVFSSKSFNKSKPKREGTRSKDVSGRGGERGKGGVLW